MHYFAAPPLLPPLTLLMLIDAIYHFALFRAAIFAFHDEFSSMPFSLLFRFIDAISPPLIALRRHFDCRLFLCRCHYCQPALLL